MKSININRNVGLNRGKARIWIEGNSLGSAGWKRGDRFNILFNEGSITYTKHKDGKRAVAGTETRPIIDTVTDKIRASVGTETETVCISIAKNKITIKTA